MSDGNQSEGKKILMDFLILCGFLLTFSGGGCTRVPMVISGITVSAMAHSISQNSGGCVLTVIVVILIVIGIIIFLTSALG